MKEIEELLVDYKTSRLAKKLGFDIVVTHYYDRDRKLHSGVYWNYNNEILMRKDISSAPYKNHLVAWVKSKYKVDVDIYNLNNVLTHL